MHLTERRLLDAVARDPGDRFALSVLADYWLESGEATRGTLVQLHCGAFDGDLALADEEARLTPHVAAWREPLIRAGFAEVDLAFDRGILQWPLAMEGDLDDRLDLFRISPRIYRVRDELQLEPDNRIDHASLAADGTVTLIDFGDVRAAEPGPGARMHSPVRFMPELRYMSPEHVTGQPVDERSDLFSLALVLAHLVDGAHPVHDADNDFDFLLAIRDRRFVLPEVPPPLAAVLRLALARHDQRIATAAALREALSAAAAASRLAIGPHVIAQRLCELGVAI